MKKLMILVAALFSLNVLSACNPVIVGDSVMNMSRPNVTNHFNNSKVNAADGRGAYNAGVNGDTGTGIQAIQAEVQNVNVGGWMVIEIGGNNMSFNANERAWFIMWALGSVPDDRCVAWVTPYVAFQQANVDAWAASIVQYVVPANQPCSAVVRWDQIAGAHPEYMADFAHPNAAGKEALVCAIVQTIGTGTGC